VSIFGLRESIVQMDSVHLWFAESIVHVDSVHLWFAASTVHVDNALVRPVNSKNVLKNVLLRSAVRTECFRLVSDLTRLVTNPALSAPQIISTYLHRSAKVSSASLNNTEYNLLSKTGD